MKAILKITDKLTVEFECDEANTLFEEIASVQEVFGEEKCGRCKSVDVRYTVRVDEEENKYYELACQNIDCRARLVFGCKKKPKGALYPKKRWNSLSDSEKQKRGPEPKSGWLPTGGWYVYKPTAGAVKDDDSLHTGGTKGEPVPF